MIPAIVIQKNFNQFISSAGISAQHNTAASAVLTTGLGILTEIPTPTDGGVIDADYWAVPVGEGSVSGVIFQPYNPNDPITSVAPSPMAFKCFRLINRFASDDWYVLGTVAEYITAAGGGAALPTTITALLAGFQTMCEFINASNDYGALFAIPTLTGSNTHYYPFGYMNGVALPAAALAGYSSIAALLVFLNANWTNVGSPATAIVWTVSADNLTLIATESAGGGDDVIAAQIVAINPSA